MILETYVPNYLIIEDYCLNNPEIESCGFVLKDNSIIKLENIAEDKIANAVISASDFLMFAGKIKAIFHSHCLESQAAKLSPTDIEQSKIHEIPVILYHTKFNQWDYFDPNELHPYPLKDNKTGLDFFINWEFEFNRSDCLTLFRSFYKKEFGINIKDYQRPITEKFPPTNWDDYQKFFPEEGFVKIEEDRKYGDVFLMKVFSSTPHHVAIFLDDKKILHILQPGELSKVQFLDEDWERRIASVWRHTKFFQ